MAYQKFTGTYQSSDHITEYIIISMNRRQIFVLFYRLCMILEILWREMRI